MSSSKRVIVTGASGFIGSTLCRRLISDGHDVHLLLRPADARWRLNGIEAHCHVHEVALQQQELLERIVIRTNPDWVFHLAAHGAYSSQDNVQKIVTTNFNGIVNLVEACLKTDFQAFVNAGSSSEYGFKDHPPLEAELPEPNSHYAATKSAATLYCQFIATQSQRRLTTLRLYSVYGPWEEPTRLMPTLLLAALRREYPPLVARTVARDFVYIDDVIDAFLLAADSPHPVERGVFNIGSGVQTTLGDLVAVVRGIFEIDGEPEWGTMQDRSWDTTVWVGDATLAESLLGWKATIPIDEGLRKLAEWLVSERGMRDYYETARSLPK